MWWCCFATTPAPVGRCYAADGAKRPRRADGAASPRRGSGQWKPPRLKRWEGPFADPTQRLAQAPEVVAERRGRRTVGRRQRSRTRKTAKVAAERDDAEWLDTQDVGTSRSWDRERWSVRNLGYSEPLWWVSLEL
jgi:hypothetical protein